MKRLSNYSNYVPDEWPCRGNTAQAEDITPVILWIAKPKPPDKRVDPKIRTRYQRFFEPYKHERG